LVINYELKIKVVCFPESSFAHTRIDGVIYQKTTN